MHSGVMFESCGFMLDDGSPDVGWIVEMITDVCVPLCENRERQHRENSRRRIRILNTGTRVTMQHPSF